VIGVIGGDDGRLLSSLDDLQYSHGRIRSDGADAACATTHFLGTGVNHAGGSFYSQQLTRHTAT